MPFLLFHSTERLFECHSAKKILTEDVLWFSIINEQAEQVEFVTQLTAQRNY